MIFNLAGGGLYTGDATATAAQVLSGMTAYIATGKVTGTLSVQTCYVSTAAPTASDGADGDLWVVS